MKYVYILTSCESDLYYEQFLTSVKSLHLYNQNAHIVVLMDSITKKGLTGKRSGYENIISEIIILPTPQGLSQREISRWIKTSMKKYISGDFFFIDCDTVITCDLKYEFPREIHIGAVLDTHVNLSKHHLDYYFRERNKKAGFSSSKTDLYFNSGVIFCRDTPESVEFFLKWHSLWLLGNKKGIHQDQPAFNQANSEMGCVITELEGEWNCQITHNGLPYLHNAKIIHCFASSMWLYSCPFLPASIPVLSSVKEKGEIYPELLEWLKNPKAAFETESRIITGKEEFDVINSKLFSILLYLRKKKPSLFKTLNAFLLKLRSKTQKSRE